MDLLHRRVEPPGPLLPARVGSGDGPRRVRKRTMVVEETRLLVGPKRKRTQEPLGAYMKKDNKNTIEIN